MNLKHRTLDGLAWTFFARLIIQIVQYAISVAVARLLAPDDFGLLAMAGVFTGVAGLFLDLGLGAALVQRPELSKDEIGASFMATCCLGVLLSATMILMAPAVADFYHRPELVAVTRATALMFVLNAVGVVPRAILQREMRLKTLASNDMLSAIVGSIVTLSLALRGAHIWALIAAALCSSLLSSLLSWRSSSWIRPSARLHPMRPLLKVSMNLLGFNFVNYWARNADNLIIGKMLGEKALGVYARAYSLMLLATSQVGGTISSAMVPAMSIVQDDRIRSQKLYLRAVGMTAFFSFPIMIGLSAAADTFIRTVYGTKWLAVIPTLRILALVGAIQSILGPAGWIFVSQGRTDRLLRIGFLTAFVIVVGFVVGGMFRSVHAVALSYLITNLIIAVPELKAAGACIGLGLGAMLGIVRKSAVSAMLMGGAVWLLGRAHPDLRNGTILVMQVALGAATYLGLAWLLQEPALADARQLVRERWNGLRRRDISGP
jgi:O-antigen/teichoic acid export membrane protein